MPSMSFASSSAPWKPRSSISCAECRQGLSLPSGVILNLLHSGQKCALSGLIRPTLPFAFGSAYSRATPDAPAGSSSGTAERTFEFSMNRSSGQWAHSPIGISSMNRTSTGRSRVRATRSGISASFAPPMSTAFIFTVSKFSSAALRPASASSRLPTRVRAR